MHYHLTSPPFLLMGLLLACTSCERASDKKQTATYQPLAPNCPPTAFNAGGGTPFTDLESAKRLTKEHRQRNPNSSGTGNCKRGRAYYFNKQLVINLLSSSDAIVGLRAYDTRDPQGKDGVILVPVGEDGNDLFGPIPDENKLTSATQYFMARTDMKCPHNCDTNNQLYQADY